jgi:hypothetical protein
MNSTTPAVNGGPHPWLRSSLGWFLGGEAHIPRSIDAGGGRMDRPLS